MKARTLLIVDDFMPARSAVALYFRLKGWEVREAATVADGIAKLIPPPDCAVVDLMLPDGDGEEIVDAIRSGHLHTCVTVYTGSDDRNRLDHLRGQAGVTVFRKPASLAQLASSCDRGDGP